MSAYVVDREHIDLLIAAGLQPDGCGPLSWWDQTDLRDIDYDDLRKHRRELTRQTADAAGAMLWLENVRSVGGRYSSPDVDGELALAADLDLPGPVGLSMSEVWGYTYTRRPGTLSPEPVAVLKAVDCYEYQSCEHDGWHDSEARSFCEALRKRMIHALPGYDEAPWGAS